MIAKAKQEGSVTIYSAQAPTSLADLATAFKAKYGIDVKVNRQVDSVMVQQITAEQGSGKPVADLWVQASKNYTLGAVKNKWVTAPIGPNFYAKGFNRKTLLGPGPTAIVAAAVLGMAWNTRLYPQGIKDIPDFLDPKLTGQDWRTSADVGVLHRLVPLARGDYGKNILNKLAAQKPKIYLSSLTMMQAVISGEITASPFVPGLALDQKKIGAPIDFKLANKGQGVERSLLGDDPQERAAPECGAAPRRLHRDEGGTGSRPALRGRRDPGCARHDLCSAARAEPEELHAGEDCRVPGSLEGPLPAVGR